MGHECEKEKKILYFAYFSRVQKEIFPFRSSGWGDPQTRTHLLTATRGDCGVVVVRLQWRL